MEDLMYSVLASPLQNCATAYNAPKPKSAKEIRRSMIGLRIGSPACQNHGTTEAGYGATDRVRGGSRYVDGGTIMILEIQKFNRKAIN